jgi:hypothetical protein
MPDDIILHAIIGWGVALVPGGEVALKIDYLPEPPEPHATTEQMREGQRSHFFGMTAEQCDELSAILRDAAEQSRKRRGVSH